MTATPWRPNVRPPLDGEGVKSSVASRAHLDGLQRTNHLKERLDAMEAGSALVRYDQSVDPDLLPGRPLYLSDSGVWLAATVEASDEGGTIAAVTEKGAALGALLRVTSVGTGDVLLSGYAEISDEHMEAACSPQEPQEGPVWLGSAGGLSFLPSGLSILLGYVKQAESGWLLFWHGAPSGTLYDHIHLRFELAPIMDEASVPGDSFPGSGWLETDSFPGVTPPAGAAYGYMVAEHADLSAVWPPIPVGTAAVYVDGLEVTGAQVIVNEDGIWWMDEGTDPDDYARITLLITQYGHGSPAIVNSIVSDSAILNVKDKAGETASIGHLRLSLANPKETTNNDTSSAVVRSLNLATGEAVLGHAVTAIKSGGGIVITGDDAGNGYRKGRVTLVGSGSIARDMDVEVVALDRAEERIVSGHTLLVFPANTLCSIRGSFRIDDIPGTLSVRIGVVVAALWGTVTVATSAPTLGVRIVPVATSTAATLPIGADTVVEMTGPETIGNGKYALLTSDAISVTAGAVVQFTLSRGNTAGVFGVLQLRPMLAVS